TIEIIYSISTMSLAMDGLNAYAQFNDPFSFNRLPSTVQRSTASSVSEPGSIALLSLSLLGLAGYRRKVRNQK
ncbi:MAG: PEP-CTERM sorting domain-containing protein, partial [Alishewanella sp.]|nr:PEP-CTERM sorting domain-containing protein [Alishewanella sp.]